MWNSALTSTPLAFFARILPIPVAFLDLFRDALYGLSFQLLGVLVFTVTHVSSSPFAIDSFLNLLVQAAV